MPTNKTHRGISPSAKRFMITGFRFLVTGGLNTLATFIIYWVLLNFVGFQLAYAISFVAGVGISYLLGTKFVFQTRHTLAKMAMFPFIYLASYGAGAFVLHTVVTRHGVDPKLAPLIAICVTLPLTFLLTKWILDRD